jgi:hypothetical protein
MYFAVGCVGDAHSGNEEQWIICFSKPDANASDLAALTVQCAFFDRKLHSRSTIEFHACAPLEANRRVTYAIPVGWPLSYRLTLVNCVSNTKGVDK